MQNDQVNGKYVSCHGRDHRPMEHDQRDDRGLTSHGFRSLRWVSAPSASIRGSDQGAHRCSGCASFRARIRAPEARAPRPYFKGLPSGVAFLADAIAYSATLRPETRFGLPSVAHALRPVVRPGMPRRTHSTAIRRTRSRERAAGEAAPVRAAFDPTGPRITSCERSTRLPARLPLSQRSPGVVEPVLRASL